MFEHSNDSLLDSYYFDNVADSSTSSSDCDSLSANGQAHNKRHLLRTLAHLATAATDTDNAVLEVRDTETSSVQVSNGTRKRKSNPKAWKKAESG